MKVLNALKKIEKHTKVEKQDNQYRAVKNGYEISFYDNGGMGEVTCIKIRRTNDVSDSMTDYFAGSFCDTITEAIKRAGFMEVAA